jgi:hypothetical protein
VKGVLTKGSSTNRNLRTKTIEGFFAQLPEVGKPFIMLAEPLDEKKDFRYVRTSIVLHVERAGEGYKFETFNSMYTLRKEKT